MCFVARLIYSILTISLFMSLSPEAANAELIDKIVAQVGTEIITLSDVEGFAPAEVRSIYAIKDELSRREKWDTYFNSTVDILVEDKVLQISAARMGISASDQEIKDSLVHLQERNAEIRRKIQEILKRENTTTPELYLLVKKSIVKSKLDSVMLSRAIVTDTDVRQYIKENPGYELGTDYDVNIAFFETRSAYDTFVTIFGKKKDFVATVEAASGSVIDMGWIKIGDIVDQMRSALVTMQSGSVSSPIEDENGRITILQLKGVRSESVIPDNIRNEITYTLKEQQLEMIFNRWLERQKQSIVVYKFS